MTDFMLVTPESFSVTARETIRAVADRDHLFLRVSVRGPHFAQRGAAPFVRVVRSGGETVEALIAVVSADQKELHGYFPTDTAIDGKVEFGYAGKALGSVSVGDVEPERLDAKRVGSKVHRVTQRDLGPFNSAITKR